MHKFIIAGAIALSVTVPAMAEMEIGDYPKSLDEVEYCLKARLDSDIDVPYGCRTLGERILIKVREELED